MQKICRYYHPQSSPDTELSGVAQVYGGQVFVVIAWIGSLYDGSLANGTNIEIRG